MYSDYDIGVVSGSVFLIFSLVFMILMVFEILCVWRVYKKAGKPGWASIVPVYNIIVMLEIAQLPVWYIFLSFIPLVNIWFVFKLWIELAKKFGHNSSFGVLMAFFPYISLPFLAFGKSTYQTPNSNDLINNNSNVDVKINDNLYNQQVPVAPVVGNDSVLSSNGVTPEVSQMPNAPMIDEQQNAIPDSTGVQSNLVTPIPDTNSSTIDNGGSLEDLMAPMPEFSPSNNSSVDNSSNYEAINNQQPFMTESTGLQNEFQATSSNTAMPDLNQNLPNENTINDLNYQMPTELSADANVSANQEIIDNNLASDTQLYNDSNVQKDGSSEEAVEELNTSDLELDESKTCPNCGNKLSSDDTFCVMCGTKV